MSLRVFHAFLVVLIFNTFSVDPLTQDVYWRDYIPGEIPYDAIEAAPGRYIGQVLHDGFLVGQIYPGNDTVYYEYYGHKSTKKNIKILCSRNQTRLYWEKVDFNRPHDQQMNDAVKGGYMVFWDSDLFIGKTFHEGEWKVGMVFEIDHPTYAGLYVWNDNGTQVIKQFYMLKYNSTVAVEKECQCEYGERSSGQKPGIWLYISRP